MNDPLKVSLENIIPLTEARDHFSQIVAEVQNDKLYVLTKGGKPAVAIIDVKYLEALTGGEIKEEHIEKEIAKAPQKVGLPPMVEHDISSPPPAPPPPVPPSIPKPAPIPPKPTSIPPRPITYEPPKPESKPEPPAPPRPPSQGSGVSGGPKPAETKPVPSPAPQNPSATLKTPPIETPTEKANTINVQVAPDSDVITKAAAEDKKTISGGSEDEAGPAQYSGPPKKVDEGGEPEDMVID